MIQKKQTNWHLRFKAMKKDMGYTNAHIAQITGNTTDSIKHSTQPKLELPRWARLAITVYETMIKDKDEARTEEKQP